MEPERRPQVGLLATGLSDEAARRDAYDRECGPANEERLAEHFGPGPQPFPVGMADDGRLGAIVLGAEQSAYRRRDAERFEERVGDEPASRDVLTQALNARLELG